MTRIKSVFRTDEIAHMWAHGLEPIPTVMGNGETRDQPREIRNSGRTVFAIGDTVFSYGTHFPMAQRIETEVWEFYVQGKYNVGTRARWETVTTEETRETAKATMRTYRENEPAIQFRVRGARVPGPVVFLINPGSYSTTTSSHQSGVRQSIPHEGIAVDLPVEYWPLVERGARGATLRAWFISKRAESMDVARNERCNYGWRKHSWRAGDSLVSRWERFHAAMGFRCDVALPSEPVPDLEEACQREKEQEEQRAERERVRREEAKKEWAERLPAWRAGTYNGPMYGHGDVMRTRTYPDGEVWVETSQGARVPLSDVASFVADSLPHLVASIGKVFADMIIGSYRGCKATQEHVQIGCHRIPWSEIRALAMEQGWTLPDVNPLHKLSAESNA